MDRLTLSVFLAVLLSSSAVAQRITMAPIVGLYVQYGMERWDSKGPS